jgi:hypothetical protein
MTDDEGYMSVINKATTVDFSNAQLQKLQRMADRVRSFTDEVASKYDEIKHGVLTLTRENSAELKHLINQSNQLVQHRSNQLKIDLDQALDIQKIVAEVNLNLKSYVIQRKPSEQIVELSRSVNRIYTEVSKLAQQIADQYNQTINKWFRQYPQMHQKIEHANLGAMIQQAQEVKKQIKEQIKEKRSQVAEAVAPVVVQLIKKDIKKQQAEVQKIEEAVAVCRHMRKLKIDPQSVSCQKKKRQSLSVCPPTSRWCNYCLEDPSQCNADKLPRTKGKYQYKPREK